MSRTLAIGDIHGEFQKMKQLLELANFKPSEDTLICVGDYVDRGPDSALVLEYLAQLDKDYPDQHFFCKGNHDEWLLQYIKDELEDPSMFENQGGRETLESYEKYVMNPKDHLEFLENLNYFVTIGDKLFVHAGYTNKEGPWDEYNKSNLWWDRDFWGLITYQYFILKQKTQSYKYRHFEEIYIGHTPTIHLKNSPKVNIDVTKPVTCFNVTNMDTGVCYGGKLSLMDVDTKELWQV